MFVQPTDDFNRTSETYCLTSWRSSGRLPGSVKGRLNDEPGRYILILTLYMPLVGIGVIASRRMRNSEGFCLGGRSVGRWLTTLSFLDTAADGSLALYQVGIRAPRGAVAASTGESVTVVPFLNGAIAHVLDPELALARLWIAIGRPTGCTASSPAF